MLSSSMKFIITFALVLIPSTSSLPTVQSPKIQKRSPKGVYDYLLKKTFSSPTTNIPTVLPNEPVLLLERIPKYVLTDRMLLFLNFDDAINLKGIKEFDLSGTNSAINTLNFGEEQIIQHYSGTEPDAVVQYIFRDLDSLSISDESRLEQLNSFLSNPSVQRKLEEERHKNNHQEPLIMNALQKSTEELVQNGKLWLLKNILVNGSSDFSFIKIIPKHACIAAQKGQKEVIRWILDSEESYAYLTPLTYYYLRDENDLAERRFASIDNYLQSTVTCAVLGKSFEIFKMCVDLKFSKKNILQVGFMDALQLAINQNLEDYFDYFLGRLRSYPDEKLKDDWYSYFIAHYVTTLDFLKRKPEAEKLDILFRKPDWNPVRVSTVIKLMDTAYNFLAYRIGLEFLNPRLKFNIKVPNGVKMKTIQVSGFQALDAAIQHASAYKGKRFRKWLNVLKEIREDVESIKSDSIEESGRKWKIFDHNEIEEISRKRPRKNQNIDDDRYVIQFNEDIDSLDTFKLLDF